jgi:hypothetical protein
MRLCHVIYHGNRISDISIYKQVDLKLINGSYTFIDVMDIQVKAINERIQIKQYKLGLSINFLKQWTHYSLQQPGLQDVIGS